MNLPNLDAPRSASRHAMRPLLVALVLLLPGCVLPQGDPGPAAGDGAAQDAAPVTFEALRFETSLGAFTAILFPEETPETVAFMKTLVERRYYDGREFNRVIPGFVIQEVDRLGGATDQQETVSAEFGTRVMFSAGAIGIARNEDPESGGSEFFVMDFAHSHLYGNYTAFAQVVEGLDVVRAIARVETVSTAPVSGLPIPPPVAVHDRVAVVPARIERATLVTVELPAAAAARYPLVVGPSVALENGRATFERPADLRAGAPSDVSWYVYTRPDTPVPPLGTAVVRASGPAGEQAIAVMQDPVDGRILHGAWTPEAPGAYNVTLEAGGRLLAWCELQVPPA
jgi:cyclophilin family peptidyl-prolyl cis-trans isomerase